MENFLFFFVKYRNRFLVFLILLISISAFFIKDIKVTGSTSKFFIKDDPEYHFYLDTVHQFGSDNSVIISIKGDNLFTHKVLTKIAEMIDDIKTIKGVIKVDSIFNQQNIIYRNDELHTNVFIDPEEIPIDQKVLEQVKQDAINNPLVYKNLVSDNGKLLLLNVTVKNSTEGEFNSDITKQIQKILAKYNNDLNGLLQFGNPYTNYKVIEYIFHDTKFTVPFAILVIFLTIFWSLKNLKLTMIPVTTSTLSIVAVLGFMGITGIELSILTAVVPALVILIGTTEDSYLVSEFVEEKDIHKSNKDMIIKMISAKLGLPIILTSFTTIVGFASIYLNKIVMLQDFAIVATFGLFINFIITIILVPIMLHYMNINASKQTTINYTTILDFAKNVFLKHTKKVYVLIVLVVIIFASFIPKIILDNNTLNYFKKDSEVRKRADYFKKYTNGIQSFYIVIKAPKKRAFKNWKYLHELEKIQNFIKSDKIKFKFSLSIANNLALVNKEMHDGDKKFYKVPKSHNLTAQYYLFFHRKDIKKYVNESYSTAKIDVWHNIFSSSEFNKQKAILAEFIKKNIDPSLEITITGKNVLLNKAADTISVGQTKSVLTTFLVVFLVISLVFRTMKAGIVILAGNIIPIIILFGVMGMFDIPLNVVTAIIATITFGIVVDDTIHLMMRYRYEHHKEFDKFKAVTNSITGEGRAVLMTTISLMIGYFTLATSEFVPVIQFALLSIIVIFVAVLSDLFFVPSLIKNIDIIKEKNEKSN